MPNDKNKELFRAYVEDAQRRDRSNSEHFDRAILTLSSAGLGLSIGFIKMIVPLEGAICPYLLILSWMFFGLAIFSTVFSFKVGQCAIKISIRYASIYYLSKNKKRSVKYKNKKSCLGRITEISSNLAGIFYLLALVFIIVFVSINLVGLK